MPKVFRLYTGGDNTFRGWNESPTFPYSSTARATIADPDGASANNEITSIPSPFARIDLVKNAFREVYNIGNLDGNTIFHKMVSDTLDVGEIFFNIDKLKDKVEIITWKCSTEIQQLKEDPNNGHSFLADSLDKYLMADGATYNFNLLQNIYLLNYVDGPDELNIIGATSPATLFFCGANNLSYIKDIFFPNNDKPFDSAYQPLYKRENDYIKAWWTLRKSIPNFSTLFPEIDDYLNLTFLNIADQTFKQELNAITATNISNFSTIDVQDNNAINQVEVIGYQLLKKKSGISNTQCDFVIGATKPIPNNAPLVLPIESGNKYANLDYVNGKWGNNNKANVLDPTDIDSRSLPFDGNVYPYLTISDFLEDVIISVPYELNKKQYFNGNIEIKGEAKSYLLPIKPLYFKFFSPEDLMGTMSDGKKAFEMEMVGNGSVNVTIRIPIKGNAAIKYIEYRRIYYVDNQPNISESSNDGGARSLDFAGFVMPGVKFTNVEEAYYTISYVSTFSNKAKLEFYNGNSMVGNEQIDCRNPKSGVFALTTDTYTLEHCLFDFIRVIRNDGSKGILLPKFAEYVGVDSYEFSIDLGTTNTHIEMKKSTDTASTPFSYNEAEYVISKFFMPSYMLLGGVKRKSSLIQEDDVIDADVIPSSIGNDFSFPTRTALSIAKNIDWHNSQRVFGLLNLTMTYDKRKKYDYNADPIVNIKWGKDVHSNTAMKLYVKNILLLIRNKVVANNGKLSATKIVWFYPDSMSNHRLAQLRNAWNDAYSDMFGAVGNITSKSESVAPIQYFFRRYSTATNLVNVDIGGGTTDIAFSDGGVVNYITSFKFGANSLFEDSFSDINPNNGIIDYFKDDILDLLKKTSDCGELAAVFNDNVGHPANMASFLFSLKDNKATHSLNKDVIDFNRVLQNDDNFKIVFLLFYTAIIYHIAQVVRVKNLKLPRHIAFSGNGSKVINVITNDTDILAKYTKKIFEKVLSTSYESPLELLGLDNNNNPKEATCKGGLISTKETGEPKHIMLKNSQGDIIDNNDKYSSIDNKYKNDIIKMVSSFFHTAIYDIPKELNLDDMFGISKKSLEIAQRRCRHDYDLLTYLDKGITLSIAESGDTENVIEDALPFYPIQGFIQSLSTDIYKSLKANNANN